MEVPEGYILVRKEEYEALQTEVLQLRSQVKELISIVEELRGRLNLNSKNSSKPPSSDGLKRQRSLREPSEKKTGGQEGHEGNWLKMAATPDHVIQLQPDKCEFCGEVFAAEQDYSKLGTPWRHQVFDIPPPTIEVTEYQAFSVCCNQCGRNTSAVFPEGVERRVQYGPRINAALVYLSVYQALPMERTVEMMKHFFRAEISNGKIHNTNLKCFKQLAPFDDRAKEVIIESNTVNFDESGVNIHEGPGSKWLHVASTPKVTLLKIHPSRGHKAMDDIGILPNFKNNAIHDRFSAYAKYNCKHGYCNTHCLRELKFLKEDLGLSWAGKMSGLLMEAKELSEATPSATPAEQLRIEQKYNRIVGQGLRLCANDIPQESIQGKRGRKKQSKAKNLLDDLKKNKDKFLLFLYDPSVPFDNNAAEREVRMPKVKLKISGGFRSIEGAEAYARIRSYVSTVKKNGLDILDSIANAIRGKPFMPC